MNRMTVGGPEESSKTSMKKIYDFYILQGLKFYTT